MRDIDLVICTPVIKTTSSTVGSVIASRISRCQEKRWRGPE
jgi:hypothetical protein